MADKLGAQTIGVVNVASGPLAEASAISVHLLTGAEPIMGSTRMRAGLSQKLWLNVFSTAVMVTLGLTFDNLMVNVAPYLVKLRTRRLRFCARRPVSRQARLRNSSKTLEPICRPQS